MLTLHKPALFLLEYFSPAGLEAYVFKTSRRRIRSCEDISHGGVSVVSLMQMKASFSTSDLLTASPHSKSALKADALKCRKDGESDEGYLKIAPITTYLV